LNSEEIRLVVKQLAAAVAHLHAAGVCHKDIKPENVLIRSKEDDSIEIRLIDFNVSQKATDGKFNMISKTGTELFMSPEMLSSGNFDEKIDVWGVGCILCFLLIGKMPRNGSRQQEEGEDSQFS